MMSTLSETLLPILKDTKDPHYRYKMPKLAAKIEGSGNGIKTVVTNMAAVSKAINRPPSYATKYFGTELGAQTKINLAADSFVINGAHDSSKLLTLLYNFINKFVLCNKCKNPETNITVVNKQICQKCIACGFDTTIPKSVHKLTTFIINHPPESSGSGGMTPSTGSHKSSKSKKKYKSKSDSPSNNDSGNDHSQIDYYSKEPSHHTKDDSQEFDDQELTAEAYSERMRELCEGLNSGMYLSDPKESANAFFQLVEAKQKANVLHDTEVHKELIKEAERLNIRDKAVLILSELLFTENMIKEIAQNRLLLLRFCYNNQKAQKYLLGGFEKLVGDVYKEQLLSSSLKVLKCFYDEEILDEEVIIEWSNKVSKKYVSRAVSTEIHEKVSAFIKWLKEAEEESEESGSETNSKQGEAVNENEDEDEDDGVDLEFSHRVSGMHIESVSTPLHKVGQVNHANETNLDDLEIDEI